MEIKIKCNGQPIPVSHGEYYDLTTAEDAYLRKGEYKRISLGVAMDIPEGYYGFMVPRSSTFEKFGVLLANSVGIYENAYCGDGDIWAFLAYATRETIIPKGTRICQFAVLERPPRLTFCPVESMEHPDRGGFGSTGE